MNLKTNLFAILAIFCVILSACAVSANDTVDYSVDDAQSVHDDMVLPPDYSHNEAAQHAAGEDIDSEAVHNDMILPPDANHNEEAMLNATGNATNSTNATVHAAGEGVSNTTGNATNATATHNMLATGNPILALLAIGAVLGGATVITRKK